MNQPAAPAAPAGALTAARAAAENPVLASLRKQQQQQQQWGRGTVPASGTQGVLVGPLGAARGGSAGRAVLPLAKRLARIAEQEAAAFGKPAAAQAPAAVPAGECRLPACAPHCMRPTCGVGWRRTRPRSDRSVHRWLEPCLIWWVPGRLIACTAGFEAVVRAWRLQEKGLRELVCEAVGPNDFGIEGRFTALVQHRVLPSGSELDVMGSEPRPGLTVRLQQPWRELAVNGRRVLLCYSLAVVPSPAGLSSPARQLQPQHGFNRVYAAPAQHADPQQQQVTPGSPVPHRPEHHTPADQRPLFW